MLKIQGIDIRRINGIKSLDIQFNPYVNIICGANGVGKTTVLECIYDALQGNKAMKSNLKRNLDWGFSGYQIYGEIDYSSFLKERHFEKDGLSLDNIKLNKEYLYFSIFRTQSSNFWGNKFTYVTNWFGKVYNKNHLTISEFEDIKTAIHCFNKLDSKIRFSRVKVRDHIEENGYSINLNNVPNYEILVETIDGELTLTDLSSGYLSCLIIFLEIIKKATQSKGYSEGINNFDGIILIDEIDLHLHPEWQKKILEILRWMVPNAQIIATTHSPHIVQSAEVGEVITLKNFNGDCKSVINKTDSKYGYQGWTIEEILEDIMELKSTKSNLYDELLKQLESAIDTLNRELAVEYLRELKHLIHPNNPIGKILGLQVAGLGVFKYDKN